MRKIIYCLCGLFFSLSAMAGLPDGRTLVETSLQRHAPPPHLYEEQSMILTDRQGQHTVRTTRHYARFDGQQLRKLYVIETPTELKGARLYLEWPASGKRALPPSVFGSDFSVADLAVEQIADHAYETTGIVDLERIPHLLVRARPLTTERSIHGAGERHLYLRRDNLFVSRIDYLDSEGHPVRRLSFRDPRADDHGAWHAGMMLMENLKEGRRSLLKIDRRVLSPDYLPETVFAAVTGVSR